MKTPNRVTMLFILTMFHQVSGYSQGTDTAGRTEMMRKMYAGWNVSVNVEPQEAIVGEYLFAKVRFSSDSPRVLPWKSQTDVENRLFIHEGSEDGPEITTTRLWAAKEKPDTERVSFREYTIELTTRFMSPQSGVECGYSCITPGHYVGRFSHGVESAPFSFDVLPVPTEYRTLWDSYRAIRGLTETRRRTELSNAQFADSVRHLLDVFLSETPDQVWRFEALVSGLWAYGAVRSEWRAEDSLRSVAALVELSSERKADSGYLISCAMASLCSGMDDQEAADVFLKLAPEIADEPLRTRVMSHSSYLRSKVKQNKEN